MKNNPCLYKRRKISGGHGKGALATNTKIGDYSVDENGIWVQ